ncbi:TrbC/VirB2 family protein [Fluoribacter dumoffii]|uniref:TrbC/VirB2 family protein n=1 Tax=Fluoribacter dumoffii TaxID=463 RepID=UPI002244BF36|nr:TrbC/VirB2 family protein [Fluoribacter dumoffii]MCW8452971.1 TrbC/VirB2 family protein [Fluoribacter dumoffii]MCW8483168.1 TrbC/VirB2 family protein [Fluoribacter dumoffii]
MSLFKKAKNRLSLAYLMVACSLFPCVSQAQSIESIINRTTHYLQGGLARAVGVACIIIAGYLCLYRQKFPKEYFSMILVGLGIIFGGSTLYNTLIG